MNEDFVITAENYYSLEADERFMSVHQYLDFVGHMGIIGCEERAMKRLAGEYSEEKTLAFQVGSYVDSYFEGTLEQFKRDNPDCFATTLEYSMPFAEMREQYPTLFTRNGRLKGEWTKARIKEEYPHLLKEVLTLKTSFKQAEKMIARCEKDELFMQTMSGEKQKIMTGYLFGCDWKIKMDSYIPGVAIVDLKTSANIHKAWKVPNYGYAPFVEYWGYTLQGAVYQKIVEINTGEKLPFYISVVTKEDSPEIAVINIDQLSLDNALNEIEMNMTSLLKVKNGEIEPLRCEQCDYCKATKKLTAPISMMDLITEGGF